MSKSQERRMLLIRGSRSKCRNCGGQGETIQTIIHLETCRAMLRKKAEDALSAMAAFDRQELLDEYCAMCAEQDCQDGYDCKPRRSW